MFKSSHSIRLAAMIAATVSSLAAQGGTFTPFGVANTYPTGISGDGTIVVGSLSAFGPAFRWTAAQGVEIIGSEGQKAAISLDGSTIISDAKGAAGVKSAAIWMGGTNWKTLGGVPGGIPVDGVLSSGYSVSGDGSVIVGLAWLPKFQARAFRWDATNGMVSLGSLEADASRANVISADGIVIAGYDAAVDQLAMGAYDYWRGAIWWQGLERLMNPYGWIGQVEGMNHDGTVIVGYGNPLGPRHAYRFTAWDGHTTDLGALKRPPRPGTTPEREAQSVAVGVSDDGSVVVGNAGWKPPLDAFIYTDETRMVKLSDYLTSRGVVIPRGWTLITAAAITPDGKTITGAAISPAPARVAQGYIATWY